MKKVIVCILVLVLCLSAFVACNQEPTADEIALEKAIAMVNNLYKSESKDQPTSTPQDYTVISKVVGNEIEFGIAWSVSIKTDGVAADAITVGEADANGDVTIHVPVESSVAIEYTLTATLSNANVSGSISFDRIVPEFSINTPAQYYAAKSGDQLIVEGLVSAILSKSDGRSGTNCIYVQDESNEGGYYVYGLSQDPITDLHLEIGMKVRVNGIVDIYNGTYELKDATVKVLDNTAKALTPVDFTEIYKENKLDSDALAGKQGMYVTLKGVTIKDVGSNGYHNFELDGKESYVRISSSTNAIAKADQDAFSKLFGEISGHVADITGIINVYNGNFYLIPAHAGSLVDKGLPQLSPADEVAYEKAALELPEEIAYAQEVELPLEASAYEDVTIAWALTANAAATLVDGVLTVNPLPYESTKLTLTATLASAADDLGAAAQDTKVFEIEVGARVLDTPTWVTTAPAAGTYKFGFAQANLTDMNNAVRNFYFTGAISGKYLSTSEYAKDAVNVTVEVVAGEGDAADTYFLSFVDKDSKTQYITIVDGAAALVEAKPAAGLGWNNELGLFTLVNGDTEYYLGTYKTYSTISASKSSYVNADNINKSQIAARLCTVVSLTPEQDKLAQDTANWSLSTDIYAADFTLPLTAGTNGTTIAWVEKTDEANCVELGANGAVTVTRPNENATVVLTATFTNGTATKSEDVTITISARELVNYAVNFSANDPTMGTVTAKIKGTETVVNSGDEIQEQTVVTFTVVPAEKHQFDSYTVNGGQDQVNAGLLTFDVKVESATTVLAKFSRIPNPIVFVSYDTNMGEVTADGYTIGNSLADGVTSVTLTVAPKAGYEVISYQIGDGEVMYVAGTDSQLTLRTGGTITVDNITANTTVTVEYRAIPTEIELVDALYALENSGDKVPGGKYTLSGEVVAITTTYSSQYGNVSFNINVEGDTRAVNVFRLGGDNASKIAVGDFVTVTGTLELYQKNAESAKVYEITGCTLDEYDPDTRKVEQAKAELALSSTTLANGAVELPTTVGETGVTVTWAEKTDSTLVTISGSTLTVAGASETDPATATIVATITSGNVTDTKEFELTLINVIPTYTVSITAGDNFAITSMQVDEADVVDGQVKSGKEVVIVLTPVQGYEIASYTINGGEPVAALPINGALTINHTVTADTTIAVTTQEVLKDGAAVDAAYALESGAYHRPVQITGIVQAGIKLSSGDYNGTIIVPGKESNPIALYWVPAASGVSAEDIKPGAVITVLGCVQNYSNSSYQFVDKTGYNAQIIKAEENTISTDAELVAIEKAGLTISATADADYTLPTAVVDGVSIAWAVEGGNVAAYSISGNAVTVVQQDDDVTVTVVATITKNSASDTVSFEVKVPKKVVVSGDTLATFTFGADVPGGTHTDSSGTQTTVFTENGYTLTLDNATKVSSGANDGSASGNSCLKLGASSTAGSFSFTVADNVSTVKIYVAGYKAKAATVTINGTAHVLEGRSNDGTYDCIIIDTSTTKTVTFAVTSGYRCMINTIEFIGTAA